jgi:hypothetical protein
MVQRRGSSPRATFVGVGRDRDTRGGRVDPIFDEILGEDGLDTPGVYQTLTAIENMRLWGVDVTPEIARKCLACHMFESGETKKRVAEYQQRLIAHQHPPIVYYMRLANLVKIGFTTNLTSRLAAINPEEVMTTEPGGREREQERHGQFQALRAHGEWFRLEAPLAGHIEAVRREAAGE